MATIFDFSKYLKDDSNWMEQGIKLVNSLPEETVEELMEFALKCVYGQVRLGLGLIDIEEDIETPVFDAIDDMYEEAAGGCYFCSRMVDPNADEYGDGSRLCPTCQMKVANIVEALGIPAGKVFKGIPPRTVQKSRFKIDAKD